MAYGLDAEEVQGIRRGARWRSEIGIGFGRAAFVPERTFGKRMPR
jgi:hypothetical protein